MLDALCISASSVVLKRTLTIANFLGVLNSAPRIVGHAKDACNGKTLLAPADFARLLHAISGREWPQERLAAELENLTSPDPCDGFWNAFGLGVS